MSRICYVEKKFGQKRLDLIDHANRIIAGYQAAGYDLTLRQLYYQFVARDLLGNTVQNYKMLGDVISEGRRAGLIDWHAIVDRTRNLKRSPSWASPQDIIEAVVQQFALDPWAQQPAYVEVWFEKDALMGVFERACETYRLPYFSCRGYTSDSEIWSAAQRLRGKRGKDKIILHFGDHDPSGMDMTRDIGDRLRLFGGGVIEVRRLALTMAQVEEYDPPPNPAKETDARYANYAAEFGDSSWELDALDPPVLAALVEAEVEGLIDEPEWRDVLDEEREAKENLQRIADNYDDVVARLREEE
jgi:hypothetical protein